MGLVHDVCLRSFYGKHQVLLVDCPGRAHHGQEQALGGHRAEVHVGESGVEEEGRGRNRSDHGDWRDLRTGAVKGGQEGVVVGVEALLLQDSVQLLRELLGGVGVIEGVA